MVTASETKIRNLLEMKGFTVVHKGAPDFLCYKLNKARRPENIKEKNRVIPVGGDKRMAYKVYFKKKRAKAYNGALRLFSFP